MAWTYDLSTDVGKVRLICGDSHSELPILSDEEIQFLIDASGFATPLSLGDATRVGLLAADLCYRKLWYLADKTMGPSHIALSQRRDAFKAVADQLAAQLGGRFLVLPLDIPCGGISHADDALDTGDAKLPLFTTHMVETQSDEGINSGRIVSSDPMLSPGGGS